MKHNIAPILEAFKKGIKFREPQLAEYSKNIEMYSNKVKYPVMGRYTFPLNNFSGYIDQYVSRMPKLRFEFKAIKATANAKAESRINAMAERDRGVQHANYDRINRHINYYAAMSGVGIAKSITTGKKYDHKLFAIDPFNFICQPYGGADLEEHEFVGEIGIWKSASELKQGAESGDYDKKAVNQLINFTSGNDGNENAYKLNQEDENKRFKVLQMNSENYFINKQFEMAEIYYDYEGDRYYALFDLLTDIVVRHEKWTDVDKEGLYPYCSFAPKEDAQNFWAISVGTDVRPSMEMERLTANEMFNNMVRIARPPKLVDTEIFPTIINPFTPDLVIPRNVNNPKPMTDGYQEMPVRNILNDGARLIEFSRSLRGTDSGINDGVLGQSSTDTVGVNERNLQMANTKQGYQNESQELFTRQIGLRYLNGLRQHLTGRTAVQVMGKNGSETVYFLKEDANPDYDIDIIDDQQAEIENSIELNKKMTALNHPIVIQTANPKKLAEEMFKIAGYDNGDISELLDQERYDNRDQIENAEQAFNVMLEKGEPKIYANANATFIKHFGDLIVDNRTEKDYPTQELVAYLQMHLPFAEENAVQKDIMATFDTMKEQMLNQPVTPTEMEGQAPAQPAPKAPAPQPPVNVNPEINNVQRNI